MKNAVLKDCNVFTGALPFLHSLLGLSYDRSRPGQDHQVYQRSIAALQRVGLDADRQT